MPHYFTENNNVAVNEGILWEGHNAVVRGTLIAWGAKLKKEKSGLSMCFWGITTSRTKTKTNSKGRSTLTPDGTAHSLL